MWKPWSRAWRPLGLCFVCLMMANLLSLSAWTFYHRMSAPCREVSPQLYPRDAATLTAPLHTTPQPRSSSHSPRSQPFVPPLSTQAPSRNAYARTRAVLERTHRLPTSTRVPSSPSHGTGRSRPYTVNYAKTLSSYASDVGLSNRTHDDPAMIEAEKRRDEEYSLIPYPNFIPTLLRRERRLLRELMVRLVEELQQGGITYMLYSGSLLGSLRHHGPVPWDDDVDILVPKKQQQQMYRRLSILKPYFFLDLKNKVRWKFYSVLSRRIRRVSWSWPFIDISFFAENATHIWDSDPSFSARYIYPREDIFPLTKRPFMDWLLFVPRNTLAVVKKNYQPDLCSPNIYNHRKEILLPIRSSFQCGLLKSYFPFVTLQGTDGGVNETLVYRNKVLGWFVYRV